MNHHACWRASCSLLRTSIRHVPKLTAFASGFVESIRGALDALQECLINTSVENHHFTKELFGDDSDPLSVVSIFNTLTNSDHASRSAPLTALAINRSKHSATYSAQLGKASSLLSIVKDALEGAWTMCRVESKGDRRVLLFSRVNKQFEAALKREGATVLTDANIELQIPVLEKVLGYTPPITKASAEDGAPIARTLLMRGRCTRKHWIPFGKVAVNDNLVRTVQKAVEWASEDQSTKTMGLTLTASPTTIYSQLADLF